MGVKYGDIGKTANDVFDDKNFADKVKITDKMEGGENVLSILPRYNKGYGLKFVYKWAIGAVDGLKAEASSEVMANKQPETEVQFTKGPLSLSLKADDKHTAEANYKDAVAGVKGGLGVKVDLASFDSTLTGNAAYELVLSGVKVQAGAKAKYELAKQKLKPEATVGLVSSFAEGALKWDGASDKTFTATVFAPLFALAGFDLSVANQTHLKRDFVLDNSAVIVQAKQAAVTYSLKLDKVHTGAVDPTVSVALSHKPVAESKEKVSITASYAAKSNKFGLFASRA